MEFWPCFLEAFLFMQWSDTEPALLEIQVSRLSVVQKREAVDRMAAPDRMVGLNNRCVFQFVESAEILEPMGAQPTRPRVAHNDSFVSKHRQDPNVIKQVG